MLDSDSGINLDNKSRDENFKREAMNYLLETVGASGRGFAVVSNEIRKLAESTKESLGEFKVFKTEIENASRDSIASIEETNKTMEKIPVATAAINDIISHSFRAVNEISQDMENFMSSFEEISASTTEITSAVDQMTSENENVTEMVENLGNTTQELDSIKERISRTDSNFMENNNKVYNKFIKLGVEVTDKQLINILEDAKVQHHAWMNTLERAVKNKQIIPLQTNSTRCGFGHFYHSLEVNDIRIKALWDEIDKHHEELHGLGELVLTHIWEKDSEDINNKYRKAKKASQEVFRIIDSIIQQLNPAQ